ncbi:hypothetical protein AVEN_244186-1 [Araneus ventricosus]|uniref:Uncharacterized protein n=1 Tax=Araneus ventricosus TaxID=182803 RepID=A0A4Y2A022_ARAVE|nr:hypothetical protein AVEN_244186-1 [Araneus ventricosus]
MRCGEVASQCSRNYSGVTSSSVETTLSQGEKRVAVTNWFFRVVVIVERYWFILSYCIRCVGRISSAYDERLIEQSSRSSLIYRIERIITRDGADCDVVHIVNSIEEGENL